MGKLFSDNCEGTTEGRATRLLADVAEIVEWHLGSGMNDEVKIQCPTDLRRI